MDCKITIKAPGAPPIDQMVGDQPLVLGRDPGCDIPVPSQYVSRRHIQLQAEGERLLLTDLGGRNPIIVNDQPITGSGYARAGDTISIADVTIEVIGPDTVSTGTVVFQPRATGP